jgi:hypothetical protein
VLYKVSHHASHNGTLWDRGLKLMVRPDLVAMIPVDEAMARTVKQWNMPFPSLLDQLTEKTGGRVLRSDMDLKAFRKQRPTGTPLASWKSFLSNLKEDDAGSLFIEYLIRG